jgi:acyl-CoA thioesterase-1
MRIIIICALISLISVVGFMVFKKQARSITQKKITIAALGDSLMAGYGLAPDKSYPEQLAASLREQGWQIEVKNYSVSGATTQDGLAKVPEIIVQKPDLILLGLGANDGLRGMPVAGIESRLHKLVLPFREANIPVILMGMRMPPHNGIEYANQYNGVFEKIATQYELPFYPFFLEKVFGEKNLMLPDGLHPNEKGLASIVKRTQKLVEETVFD